MGVNPRAAGQIIPAMFDVLILHQLAEPADVDRLLVLLTRANGEQREAAADLVRHLVPLPAVIDYLETEAA